MSTITAIFIEIVITLLIVVLFLIYLRPFLKKILVDLCGTEERAQFWAAFTNIILISLPLIFAMGFVPPASKENLSIEIIHQLRTNLTSFMLGLALIGFVLLFFTASASRTPKRETPKQSTIKG